MTLVKPSAEALNTSCWKQAVRLAFDGAAYAYDAHAAIQRETLPTLVHCWQGLSGFPQPTTWMDMGTGTGEAAFAFSQYAFSNKVLQPSANPTLASPPVLYLNDCSGEMLTLAQQKLEKHPLGVSIHPVLGDSETLVFPQALLDGISAHWVLQWIPDWQAALDHWWQHTHCLAFTVPLNDSFKEWGGACSTVGVASTLNSCHYPSLKSLTEWCHRQGAGQLIIKNEVLTQHFASGHDFLRSLKAIGAHTPFPKATSSSLRPVLKATSGGFSVTTHVAWVVMARAPIGSTESRSV
ncbi:MAG: class I SAM-dependent methyltransferase [Vampirovibrionales bacterium]|nr:class I SAM-dependent methyltransferase [Vampirovibrionales bacterium]